MFGFAFCVWLLVGYAVIAVDPPNPPELQPAKFTAAIFRDKIPVCAGAVVEVSTKYIYIATAAHCVYESPNSRLFVSIGNAEFDYKKVEPVHQVIVHPYYTPPSLDYDIAIIKIKPTQKKSDEPQSFVALNLIKAEPVGTDSLMVVNWDFKSDKLALTLGKATSEDRKSCRAKLGNVSLSRKTICAQSQCGVVPDGGPLIFQEGLVGVGCFFERKNGTLPAVFTNIANSEIYSFIEKYI